jgi:hypothetical protein
MTFSSFWQVNDDKGSGTSSMFYAATWVRCLMVSYRSDLAAILVVPA